MIETQACIFSKSSIYDILLLTYENMEKDEKCKFFAFLISALIIYSSPMKIEHGIVTSGKRLKIEKERGEFHKPENCKTSPWTFSINSEYRSFIPHQTF